MKLLPAKPVAPYAPTWEGPPQSLPISGSLPALTYTPYYQIVGSGVFCGYRLSTGQVWSCRYDVLPIQDDPLTTYPANDVKFYIAIYGMFLRDKDTGAAYNNGHLAPGGIDYDQVLIPTRVPKASNPLIKAIADGVFSSTNTPNDVDLLEIQTFFYGKFAGRTTTVHDMIGWLDGWEVDDTDREDILAVDVANGYAIILQSTQDLSSRVTGTSGSLMTGEYQLCYMENNAHDPIVKDQWGDIWYSEGTYDNYRGAFIIDIAGILDPEEEDELDELDDDIYPDDDIIEDVEDPPRFKGSADPDDIYRIEKVDVREPFNPVDCCMHIQRETPLTFPVVDVTPGRKVYYALAPDCTPLVALKNRRQGYAAADIISGKPSHAGLRAAKGQREGAWFLFTPFRNLKPDESSNETE